MTLPSQPSVLAVLMAGGKGKRLFPLTQQRAKSAVPFGGKYRIIDFVLSNFINSKITACYVLVQYLSQSLIEHLRTGWLTKGMTNRDFLTIVPPQMRGGEHWYSGTADAVAQNINLIEDYNPDLVAIFGADHIYRMDVQEMIAFHLKKKAEVTIAARPVPIKEAGRMGIIEVDSNDRVVGFEEKPARPKSMPGHPETAFSSMGNYIFFTQTLVEILKEKKEHEGEYDFGQTIFPRLFKEAKVFAYNFETNTVPGVKPHEEKGYWRDIGTISAFWQAHMDLLGRKPRFDLANPHWPIYGSSFEGPSMRILDGKIEDSVISGGCILDQCAIKRSIVGRGTIVAKGAELEECIIMDGVVIGKNVKLKKVIIDRFNAIPDSSVIGYDAEEDAKHFFRDPSGLVVMPRAHR